MQGVVSRQRGLGTVPEEVRFLFEKTCCFCFCFFRFMCKLSCFFGLFVVLLFCFFLNVSTVFVYRQF